MSLKKVYISILIGLFLFGLPSLNVFATSKDEDVRELKRQLNLLMQEVNILKKRISELENKKNAKLVRKVKKLEDSSKLVGKIEDKLKVLEDKTRIRFSGVARFRYHMGFAYTPKGFIWPGSKEEKVRDYNSWPFRLRLDWTSEVIPKRLDVYGRFTLNKKLGTTSYFGTVSNPHDQYNSFAAHQGGDTVMRVENFFAIARPPYLSDNLPVKLWFGRLRGYEGPPTRASKAVFPRLFVDSEIEGGLIDIELPKLAFEKKLTEIQYRFLGRPTGPTLTEEERGLRRIARSKYFKKIEAKNRLYIGHLKYREMGFKGPKGSFAELLGIKKGPDSNCFISQLQLKLTKSTQVFFDYLYMHSYYMPRHSFYKIKSHNFFWSETYTDAVGNKLIIPYIKPRPYHLGGIWWDTQVWKFQIYGAYYWSHFSIAKHTHRWEFSDEGWADLQSRGIDPEDYGYKLRSDLGEHVYEKEFKGRGFNGHAWFIGFNTGNLLGDKLLFWFDMTKGSRYWINPFNCKGYRRKGTVHYLSNNYFYNPGFSNDTIVAGYFPFNARVIDACLTYYLSPRTYLLLGTMYFNFSKRRIEDAIIGSSGRKRYWYPHLEWKIFF